MTQVILVLIGGFIGFLSAVGKDFLLERSKNKLKQKEFKRERLEELFILMSKVFLISIKPIQYREIDNENSVAKIAMIVRFYFLHLHEDFKIFFKSLEALQMGLIVNENQENLPMLMEAFSKEYSIFIDKISEESKKY
jgi:hypothetical protein